MTDSQPNTGLAEINGAHIYYETAGEGQPFVMIHAGVADSRQWNNEFPHFASGYHVLRYDLRGYGKSAPVEGDFSNLGDLEALIDHLHLEPPLILMGCSMGGGLAMDFALSHPSRVSALIMVGSGPSGLELDIPFPDKFAEAEKAYKAGDLDRVAEIETQIWFDGEGRSPEMVNQEMRRLGYDMNRLALANEARELGKRLPDLAPPAAGRLGELQVPVLIIVGANDLPYIRAAGDFMADKLPSARKVTIDNAAHLVNMDQPAQFRDLLTDFLNSRTPM